MLTVILSLVCLYVAPDAKRCDTIDYLLDSGLFGIYRDTLSSPDAEELALEMLGSRRRGDVGGVEYEYTSVTDRFSFEDIPCVSIYHLGTSPVIFSRAILSREWIIFNRCDSSLYVFGGSLMDFSRVFKAPLTTASDDSSIVAEILTLYVNTRSVYNPTLLLRTHEDFACLTQEYEDLHEDLDELDIMPPYTEEDKQKDIRLVREKTKPMAIKKTLYGYDIIVHTWNSCTGQIEYWVFEIEPYSMKVSDHSIVLEQVGPVDTFPR
jgi:hypothetical protein